MRFRSLSVVAVTAMSSGMVAGADTTTSSSAVTSLTSSLSSKCTPHTETRGNTIMVIGCSTESQLTTTTTGAPVATSGSSSVLSATSGLAGSTTTVPDANQLPPPTSSQSMSSILMAPPGPEEPHPDLLSSTTSIPAPVPTSSVTLLTLPSTTVTVVPLPSQLLTEIPSLSRPVPANLPPLSYSCPPCNPAAAPKTVSIECINGILPVSPPKAPSPCNCPADKTVTACYGPHPLTPAAPHTTSTRSANGFGPYTFANGTVSMIHSTGTGSAVSAGISGGSLSTSSKSHLTLVLTATVTSRSTHYVTLPSSSSTTVSHTKQPHMPVDSKSDAIPVVIPTISTRSTTSAPCAAVTVTVTTTTVSILTKFETVLEGTYVVSRQQAHTVGSKSIPVMSLQHPELSLVLKNTPSAFENVPQPTSSTKRQEPSLIPRPISFGALGPVAGNPTFANGIDGVNGGSITTSTPEAIPSSLARGLSGANDVPPAESSRLYTRGSGDNDGDFPFTVSRLPPTPTNSWITKTGVDQAPSHLSHAVPAASSGRLPRPMGPHNGTVPMGTGAP